MDWTTIGVGLIGAAAGVGGSLGSQLLARRFQLEDRREEREHQLGVRQRSRILEMLGTQIGILTLSATSSEVSDAMRTSLLTLDSLNDPLLKDLWVQSLKICTEIVSLYEATPDHEALHAEIIALGYKERLASLHAQIETRMDELGWPHA